MTETAMTDLAKALTELSDAEWAQVRFDEDRRRAQQQIIRDLSARARELRHRKPPEPPRGSGTRCGQEESHDEQTRTT